MPPRPQASVDVYVRKVVAPAVNSAGKLSTLEPVGSDFTFTLEVGVSSAVETNVAENVVLFDRLPAGLQLKQVTESPAENGVHCFLLCAPALGVPCQRSIVYMCFSLPCTNACRVSRKDVLLNTLQLAKTPPAGCAASGKA